MKEEKHTLTRTREKERAMKKKMEWRKFAQIEPKKERKNDVIFKKEKERRIF